MTEATDPISLDPAKRSGRGESFYLVYSVVLFLTVIVGFGPTFFVRPFFQQQPLHWSLILHGVVTTSWFVLLVFQTALVRLRKPASHIRVGRIGWPVIAAIFVTGMPAAIGLQDRLVEAGTAAPTSLGTATHWAQMSRDVLLFVLFAVLAIAGLVLRKKIESHKRLMLLASVVLTTPGLARLSQFKMLQWLPEPLGFLGMLVTLLALPALRDRYAEGQVHRVLKWGIPTTFAAVFLLLLLPEVV